MEFGLLWKFICWGDSGTYYNILQSPWHYLNTWLRTILSPTFGLLSSEHVPACPCLFLFCFHLGPILWLWFRQSAHFSEKLRLQAWSRTVSPYFARRYSSVLKWQRQKPEYSSQSGFWKALPKRSIRKVESLNNLRSVQRNYVDLRNFSKTKVMLQYILNSTRPTSPNQVQRPLGKSRHAPWGEHYHNNKQPFDHSEATVPSQRFPPVLLAAFRISTGFP